MGRKRFRKAIATLATVIMVFMMPLSALAGMSGSGIPGLKDEFVTRNLTDLVKVNDGSGVGLGQDDSVTDNDRIPDEDEIYEESVVLDAPLASASSARISSSVVHYLIDGKEQESISFYVKRNSLTNEPIPPNPVILSVTQTEGTQDFGEIKVEVGVPKNPEEGLKDKIRIVPLDGTYLELGKTLDFKIEFVISENMRKGKENIINDGERHFILISGSNNYEKSIPVYYGIDGLYSYYSAESIKWYEGAVITDGGSGKKYRMVGQVNLNETVPPAFTIRHHFSIFDNMMGMDEQGNPVQLRITKARLNPDGNFTFADGTTEMALQLEEDDWISIPVKVKAEVFTKWRTDAINRNKDIAKHIQMTDLLLEYNDGYFAGGNMNPLPLVYEMRYTAKGSGGGGGGGGGGSSSGGGGGGGSSSGTTSTGTVQGPAVTPRTTYASAEDVGWVLKDGVWYYMDQTNAPVTDWLLGPDGRWYFLGSDGMMKTGWLQLGSTWYFLNADGAMANGWVQGAEGKWYYLQPDGTMATNTTTPDGHNVDSNGVWVNG